MLPRIPLILVAVACAATVAANARAATTYTWNVNGTGTWTTASNWTPSRSAPASDDVLVFDGAVTLNPIAEGVTTQTIGRLVLANGVSSRLRGAMVPTPPTLTISGGTGVDLEVPAGTTLFGGDMSGQRVHLSLGAGATAVVAGILDCRGRLLPGGAGTISFNAGGVFRNQVELNPFGTTTLNGVEFQSAATFEDHVVAANPFGATAPATVVVFQPGSLFRQMADGAAALSGRTLSHFEQNSPDQGPWTLSGTGALVVDNFKVLSGRLQVQLPTVRIRGDVLSHYQGIRFNASTPQTVHMEGTVAQQIQGDPYIGFNTTLRIANPAGVTFGSDSTQIDGMLKLDGGDLTLPSPGPFAPFNVFGALDLTQGKIHTGSNRLRMTQNATLTGGNASSYVNGTMERTSPNSGSSQNLLLPIGEANTYAPVTLGLGPATVITVQVSTTTGDHAEIGTSTLNASRSVNRVWNFEPSGLPPASTVTFQFVPADVDAGADPSAFVVGNWLSPLNGWSMPTVGTRTATSIQATGITTLHGFQIAEPTFAITASAGAGGSIDPSGAVVVPHGGNRSFSIAPDAGYVILNVTVDGVSQGPISSYDFTNVTASHTISATFQPYYTITATSGAGGTVVPPDVTTLYGNGGSQQYDITPNSGFAILEVLVDGVPQGPIATYTFSNVTANHTIEASFTPTYTITSSAGAGGTITPSGVRTLNSGDSQNYTITPLGGYVIAQVVVDGVPQGPIGSYSFNNVTANHTIAATFQQVFTITASAGSGGAIAPSGPTVVNAGSDQTFTITPNSGFAVLNVVVDGVSQGAIGSYTFTNVSAAHTIAATFQQVHTITTSVGPGGSISPSGSVVVNAGASQTFTITPNAGYVILSVHVDGSPIGAVASYTFNNVIAHHSIGALFQRVFTITASAGAGGTIAPPGASIVYASANQSYSITPNASYRIGDVVVDGVPQGPLATYQFTSVGADHTISASFIRVFMIDATAGVGGTITPAGSVSADIGTSPSFTIAPGPGYVVTRVVVDGVSQGPITTFSFSNVTANHTIYASFSASCPIVATAGSGTQVGVSSFPTGQRPIGIAFADLNGDGFQDLVATNNEENTLALRLGNGTGFFGTQTSIATDRGPRSPVTGDFNGDNRQDVALVCLTDETLCLYYGNGSGGLVAGPKLFAGYQPKALATTDLNGDGRPDFVTASEGPAWSVIYRATGPSTYAQGSARTGAGSMGVATGDLNGDLAPDIVVANYQNASVSVLLNNGPGTLFSRTDVSTGYGTRDVALTDVNRDGKLDLAVTGYGYLGVERVLLGNGLGGFAPYGETSVGQTPIHTAVGDLDGDGAGDLIVTNHLIGTFTTLRGFAGSGFLFRSDYSTGTLLSATALADLNGDGALDLAAARSGAFYVTIYLGAGGSISPAGVTAPVPGSNATYTITPAAGYSIADVRVDGVSQGPISSYTFNNVTTGHTISASFTSGAGPLIVGGVANESEGDATIGADGNTLVISNIGSSGEDGVSFNATDAQTALGVEFDGGELAVEPVTDTGAALDLSVEGTADETEGELVSVRTDVTGGGLETQVDFSMVGATEQTIEIFEDGVRVYVGLVPNGTVVQRSFDEPGPGLRGGPVTLAAGDGIEGVQVGLKKKPRGLELAVTKRFSVSRATTVAGANPTGLTVTGDELRFTALASRQPIRFSRSKLRARSPGAASHFTQLRVSDQPARPSEPAVQAGGTVTAARGGGQITASGDDWQVTNLGASGNDGVAIDLSVASGAQLDFGAGVGFQIPRDSGAELTHRVRGTIGSDPDSLIATVTEAAHDDSITLRSNFAPLGATSQTIEILDEETLVHSGTYGLGQSVRVVPPLAEPSALLAASINTTRSNLKDKAAIAAPGGTSRPTLEWAWKKPGGSSPRTGMTRDGDGLTSEDFDLMIDATRFSGNVVRFRPNDGALIKNFGTAELAQRNPGVTELSTLAFKPVGIAAGARASAIRAGGGGRLLSADHHKVLLFGSTGGLPDGALATITPTAPAPSISTRMAVAHSSATLLAPEVLTWTARGRTVAQTEVETFAISAVSDAGVVSLKPGVPPDSASLEAPALPTSESYVLEVFSGTGLAGWIEGESPEVQTDAMPDRVEHRAVAGPLFEAAWDAPRSFTIVDGPTVSGDRVRFLRLNPAIPFVALASMTVAAENVRSVEFSDVDTVSVTSVPPGLGGGLALALPRNPIRASDEASFGVTLPAGQYALLEVFDVAGRRIALLHDGPLAAGTTWILWPHDRAKLGSNVLFARLKVAGGERVQKFVYLR